MVGTCTLLYTRFDESQRTQLLRVDCCWLRSVDQCQIPGWRLQVNTSIASSPYLGNNATVDAKYICTCTMVSRPWQYSCRPSNCFMLHCVHLNIQVVSNTSSYVENPTIPAGLPRELVDNSPLNSSPTTEKNGEWNKWRHQKILL